MRKFTKEEIKKLKVFWKKLQDLEDEFYSDVNILEDLMQKSLNINDLEFFRCDGDFVGIGNMARTIKLIQSEELEK